MPAAHLALGSISSPYTYQNVLTHFIEEITKVQRDCKTTSVHEAQLKSNLSSLKIFGNKTICTEAPGP